MQSLSNECPQTSSDAEFVKRMSANKQWLLASLNCFFQTSYAFINYLVHSSYTYRHPKPLACDA